VSHGILASAKTRRSIAIYYRAITIAGFSANRGGALDKTVVCGAWPPNEPAGEVDEVLLGGVESNGVERGA